MSEETYEVNLRAGTSALIVLDMNSERTIVRDIRNVQFLIQMPQDEVAHLRGWLHAIANGSTAQPRTSAGSHLTVVRRSDGHIALVMTHGATRLAECDTFDVSAFDGQLCG